MNMQDLADYFFNQLGTAFGFSLPAIVIVGFFGRKLWSCIVAALVGAAIFPAMAFFGGAPIHVSRWLDTIIFLLLLALIAVFYGVVAFGIKRLVYGSRGPR